MFRLEAKKAWFRVKAKKGMISLVSHRSENAKILSENEREISKRKRNKNVLKNCITKKILKREQTGNKRKTKQNGKKRKMFSQENDEGRFYTCISTDVLMYLNMKLYQRTNVLLYSLFIYKCTSVSMYLCMYRLKYMYQRIRTYPSLISKECKNKQNVSWELNMCIDVRLYQPINICLYWRIYVCMYRLEYMCQCIESILL